MGNIRYREPDLIKHGKFWGCRYKDRTTGKRKFCQLSQDRKEAQKVEA